MDRNSSKDDGADAVLSQLSCIGKLMHDWQQTQLTAVEHGRMHEVLLEKVTQQLQQIQELHQQSLLLQRQQQEQQSQQFQMLQRLVGLRPETQDRRPCHEDVATGQMGNSSDMLDAHGGIEGETMCDAVQTGTFMSQVQNANLGIAGVSTAREPLPAAPSLSPWSSMVPVLVPIHCASPSAANSAHLQNLQQFQNLPHHPLVAPGPSAPTVVNCGTDALDDTAALNRSSCKIELEECCRILCERPLTDMDIVYNVNQHGAEYQSIVTLNCLRRERYAGETRNSIKAAEEAAAQEALQALREQLDDAENDEDGNCDDGTDPSGTENSHLPFESGALLRAIEENDAEQCMIILTSHAFTGVNVKDDNGWTALHIAAHKGLVDVCSTILGRGDFHEVNAVNEYGLTALHYAMSKGMSDICLAILARPDFCKVNAKDESGTTTLIKAAQKKLVDVCRAILGRHDFNELNAKNNFGYSALHYAASKGMTDICRAILARADLRELNAKSQDGFTALQLAIENGHVDVCELFLSRNALDEDTGRHSQHENIEEIAPEQADEDQDVEEPEPNEKDMAVEALPSAGDVAEHSEEAQELNATKLKADFAAPGQVLAGDGDDFTPSGEEILKSSSKKRRRPKQRKKMASVSESHEDMPALQEGTLPESQQPASLSEAIEAKDIALCIEILDHPDFREVNVTDKIGWTALHNAAAMNLPEVCKAILARQDFTVVNCKNNYGNTALYYAVVKGLSDVSVAILARPDFHEVNCLDYHGLSILHRACQKGLADVCRAILARSDLASSVLNAQNEFGYTVLHFAAVKGLADTCMQVLARPDFTQVNHKDVDGATALHLAAEQGLAEVCGAILARPGFTAKGVKNKNGKTALELAALLESPATCSVFARVG